MNEMNQDESLPQGAAEADTQVAADAPKRRRSSRKTLAEVQVTEPPAPAPARKVRTNAAEVTEDVAVRPKRTRKPRVAVDGADLQPATVLPDVPTEGAPVAAALEVEEVSVEAPAAKRPVRSRKKTTADQVVSVQPVSEPAAVVANPQEPLTMVKAESELEAGPEAAHGPVVTESDAALEEGDGVVGPGGRRRNRGRRGRGGSSRLEGAAQQAAAAVSGSAEAPAQVPARVAQAPLFTLGDVEEGDASELGAAAPVMDGGVLFTEVLAGTYDQDAEGDVAEELGKRVLRPEPEAPKLHKVLAQSGIGSRRDMEDLIEQGQVTVNGEVAHVGMRVARGDQVKIAGRPVKIRIAPPPARVIAYHKPVGEVVTHHDPEGRPTVFRNLPRLPAGKWLSVGRLDINTEGLLLFTNSGDLANQLMHPRFGVEREYAARVLGTLDEVAREKLLTGVEIDGQQAAFKSIEDGGGEGANHWYRVVINEGRNREVRKLFESVGLAVSRLIRIRYGTVVLPRGLKRGVWVELHDDDVRAIRRLANPEAGSRQGTQADAPAVDKGRGRGAQHGGVFPKGGGQAAQGQGGRGQQGSGKQQRGKGPGGRQSEGGMQGGGFERRDDRREDRREPRPADDEDIPLRIPNPLEQTFDRRFATGSKRITSGFGRPMDEDRSPQGGRGQKGGPKQPDPMQTSVGYIGADAYFSRPGQGKNRGGRRR